MSSYLKISYSHGCHWQVKGAPNEDTGRYTLVVDEISLAYPVDENGNTVPLKTGVSFKSAGCFSIDHHTDSFAHRII